MSHHHDLSRPKERALCETTEGQAALVAIAQACHTIEITAYQEGYAEGLRQGYLEARAHYHPGRKTPKAKLSPEATRAENKTYHENGSSEAETKAIQERSEVKEGKVSPPAPKQTLSSQ
jgi:flagellar biosynthesis/type III secretory pathway protein FliH